MIRISKEPEIMLALVTVVCEALSSVSEQIIRRSYGRFSLQRTLAIWSNLRRQLRVVLLMISRLSELSYAKCIASVHDLDTVYYSNSDLIKMRHASIYKVLALDTLSFTTRADHAVDQENYCREEYNRNVLKSGSEENVLISWGIGADTHWRKLLSALPGSPTAVNNDYHTAAGQVQGQGQGQGEVEGQDVTRMPLLMLFPYHNQPSILAVYRALEQSARFVLSPSEIHLQK